MRPSLLLKVLPIIVIGLSLTKIGYPQQHWCRILDEQAVPINQLPKFVVTSEGKLSVWADFANTSEESITVYLINQTSEVIAVPTQDGNPYLKLEGQLPNDQWARAEPHVYSWCGNSYFNSPKLPPDHFLRISGWYPSQGTETQIRYTIFSKLNVSSNSGRGRIQKESVQEAQYDAMAIRFGDIDLIRTVILEKKDTSQQWPDLTNSAIRRLDDFPSQEIIPIIETVLYDDHYGLRSVDDAIRIYAKHAPVKAGSYLMKQLLTGDTDSQKHILSIHDRLIVNEEGYLPFLENHCRAIESPLRFDAMRALIRLLGEEAKMPLLGILKSTEDKRTRRYIKMLWERKFGKHHGISLKADYQGTYDGISISKPMLIEITLTNQSKQEQSFSYNSPFQLFGFWITANNAPIPLESRHTLPPLEDSITPSKTVQLAPGDTHKVMVDLRDFFAPSELAAKSITFYVRCRLPGIHTEPFVDSTGYGLLID